MNRTLANLVGFQLVWFAAVGGAAHGHGWAGPATVAVFALLQLHASGTRRADLRLMLGCALLGFAVDSLWVQAGWMRFASPGPWPSLAPAWIVAMWIGFGLTINHSLAALKARPWLAVVFGLLGGPLAYAAAAHAWHAVTIPGGLAAYVALGIAWGIVTPLLLRVGGPPTVTAVVAAPAKAA